MMTAGTLPDRRASETALCRIPLVLTAIRSPACGMAITARSTPIRPRTSTAIPKRKGRAPQDHYATMTDAEIAALPVNTLAADDCVLFLWAVWPKLDVALAVIGAWGFTYKTCAFDWTKAHAGQIDMFRDDADVQIGMGDPELAPVPSRARRPPGAGRGGSAPVFARASSSRAASIRASRTQSIHA